MPAHFYLLSLHHRTLSDVLRRQHPLQTPLPFSFVVAIVSGIADALEAAASKGVVHLNMSADNVMVDEPEMVAHEADRRRAAAAGAVAVAAGGDGGIAEDIDVEYSVCIRRFEEPPVAVVTNWGASMVFDVAASKWVLPQAQLRDRLMAIGQPWSSNKHAAPELHIALARAKSELTPLKDVSDAAQHAIASAPTGVCRLQTFCATGAMAWACQCLGRFAVSLYRCRRRPCGHRGKGLAIPFRRVSVL
jgi:serine/threonine protein kinase